MLSFNKLCAREEAEQSLAFLMRHPNPLVRCIRVGFSLDRRRT